MDDDVRFLSTLEAILSPRFEVVACSDPMEALQFDFDTFHVVCSDYNMPRLNGLEYLAKVAQRSTQTCCLLLTGADDFYESIKRTARRPPVVFKPIDPARFIAMVAHLVSIAQMKRATSVMVGAAATSSRPPPSEKSARATSAMGGAAASSSRPPPSEKPAPSRPGTDRAGRR